MEDIDYSFKLDHYRKFALTLNNPAFRLRNKAVRMNVINYQIINNKKNKLLYLKIRKLELLSILIQRHFYMYEANYNHILEDYKNGIYPERLHKYDFYNSETDYDYNMKYVIRGSSPTILLTHFENTHNFSLGKCIYKIISAEDMLEDVINSFRDDGRIQEMPVEEMLPFLKDQVKYKYFKKELKFLKDPKYESIECMVCSEPWNSVLKLNLICGHSICNSCMNNLVSQKCPACRTDLVSYEREEKKIELLQYELQEECPVYICDNWFQDIAEFAIHMLDKIKLCGIFEMDFETLIDYEDAKYEDLNKLARISFDNKIYVLCSG